MYTGNAIKPAGDPLAYMPSVYYLYGRPQRTQLEAARVLYPQKDAGYQVFDFSPDHGASSIDQPPHTIEQLLTHGYFAVPKAEPELSLIEDRKQTSWLGLDDALTQIQDRRKIYEKNMLELEWSKCYAFNELARHGWGASEQQYARYHRRLQELHSEQRAERIAFWKDVSMLRRSLPEVIQQYLSAYRKMEILGDDGGDSE